jgi:hypothetical protein
MSESVPPEMPSDGAYERRDLDPRWIGLFAAGGAAVILFAAALTFWMARSADRRRPSLPPTSPPRLSQGPDELRQMRAAEEAFLNSYGWIDREKGIVRIPVERAMEMAVEMEKAKVKSKKERSE